MVSYKALNTVELTTNYALSCGIKVTCKKVGKQEWDVSVDGVLSHRLHGLHGLMSTNKV